MKPISNSLFLSLTRDIQNAIDRIKETDIKDLELKRKLSNHLKKLKKIK